MLTSMTHFIMRLKSPSQHSSSSSPPPSLVDHCTSSLHGVGQRLMAMFDAIPDKLPGGVNPVSTAFIYNLAPHLRVD